MDNLEPIQSRPRNSLPVILLASVLLLIIFIVGLRSGLSPGATLNENVPFGDVERVTLNQAYVAFLQEEAVFVDVRPMSDYDSGHIPQAISIPLTSLETRYSRLDSGAWAIVYGEAADESDSAAAAEFLLEQGFQRVSVVFGGIEAWVAAGHPVDP
ncbi:MAG: rhodanese-like domain-containing protein [Anaerolineales bacterium]